MRLIGAIVGLQVQEVSLKVDTLRWRQYDPSGLRAVPVLELTDGGVHGWTADGEPIADVHHRDHPASKNRGGENGISIGFTSHYRKVRERFSDHLTDGIAGENILVETDDLFTAADLPSRLVIATVDGREIRLDDLFPAAPCVEFSRYASRRARTSFTPVGRIGGRPPYPPTRSFSRVKSGACTSSSSRRRRGR